MPDDPLSKDDDADRDNAEHCAAARNEYRVLKVFAIGALVVSSASALTLNLVDPDLWGHVAYGCELILDGELPATATHTFTAEGHPWVNHENLAEIALAMSAVFLGVRGMLVGKCLLGLGLLTLMYWVARRNGVRALVAWGFLFLIANNLKAFFILRPQLLSFTLCAVMLVMLDLAFRRWRSGDPSGESARLGQVRWRWLLPVPLLMILWVNSHGGFVAGLCIFGALLGGRIVEAVVVDRGRSIGVIAGLAVTGMLALGTVLVNPYGFGLVEWLAESLGSPRPEITEWAAPKVTDPVFVPLVFLLATNLIAWAFTDRRRDWPQAVILALVAWQSCSHLRHIAFFALLSGFWTPPHLQSVLGRLRNRSAEGLPVLRLGRPLRGAFAAGLLLAITLQSFGIADRVTQLPVYRSMYPWDAFNFMAGNNINGRMVVSFNWAQYALAAFPDSTVAFDGRFRTCYPQEVVDAHFDFLIGWNAPVERDKDSKIILDANGEATWKDRRRFRSAASGEDLNPTKALEQGDPELVIVDRNYWVPVTTMQRLAEEADCRWSLLYQDKVAQVWGQKSVFDEPASDRYLAPERRLIGDAERPYAIQWPAMPRRKPADVAQGPPTAPPSDS